VTSLSKKLRGLRPLEGTEMARLTFHGAAGGVTGSCYLLETAQANVLVECGLFQGSRSAEAQNRRAFPFPPEAVDAVVLTHAHIDHSGRLPKLVRDGYEGPVHVTGATAGLLDVMLLDSAHIQEESARHATRRSLRRGGQPVPPLYDVQDAERSLRRIEAHPFGERVQVAPGVDVRFRRAEHILGAASVELWVREDTVERKIVFSGDLGRYGGSILLEPDPPTEADLFLMESTYGDRDHRAYEETIDELAEALADAAERRAKVLIPAFAVGRTQELLLHIGRLERAGRIPVRPVYLDSPMAIDVTAVYMQRQSELLPELRAELAAGDAGPQKLELCPKQEDSIALNERSDCIVVAGSGMCDAGRIVHHLRHNLWREGTRVLIVGFQARGTIGRALVDGARKVRIFGEEVLVRARIDSLGGFSAHAGRKGLVAFAQPLLANGAHLALVHGEPEKRSLLAERLAPRSRHPILEPLAGDAVALHTRGEPVVWVPAPRRSRNDTQREAHERRAEQGRGSGSRHGRH